MSTPRRAAPSPGLQPFPGFHFAGLVELIRGTAPHHDFGDAQPPPGQVPAGPLFVAHAAHGCGNGEQDEAGHHRPGAGALGKVALVVLVERY